MIGKVSLGRSFYHCISYCLEDKRGLSEEQKKQLSRTEDLQHQHRAEVLDYHLCFGNKYELSEQFQDVRKLNKHVEKPVCHLSIRLAPGDQLTPEQWREVGQTAAAAFGMADHQYICILHKDTPEPHIHIVGNRVGYDGKVTSDSNNYRRMADLCRHLEKQYRLTEVVSPRRFLSPNQRQAPRHDQRKERLKENIREALQGTRSYPDFEKKIQASGYYVNKGRGIAFEDAKKVRIKGSEVGYSLATIEQILRQNEQEFLRQFPAHRQAEKEKIGQARQKVVGGLEHRQEQIPERQFPSYDQDTAKGLGHLLQELMKPVRGEGGSAYNPWEEEERRRQKKKKKLRP